MAAWTAYDLVKLGLRLDELLDEYSLLENALEECISGESKKAKTQNNGDGAKVKGIRPKTKVKCFNKKQDKHDEKEYDRQLKNQQDGLNSMSADDYIEGRKAFLGYNPCDGSSASKVKRNPQKAREAREKELARREVEYRRNRILNTRQKAKDDMKTLAALHNPDMIAGGMDKIIGFGHKGINSSIGAQWKDRVGDIDRSACMTKKEGKGKEKMNTELKRCKK